MEHAAYKSDDPIPELRALYTTKSYTECEEMCKEVLTVNPVNLQALLYMADMRLEQRNAEDVVHYCNTIISAKTDEIYYVWQMHGQALCLLKRYEEARESFGAAIRLMSSESKQEGMHLWSLYALTLFMQGDKERAFNLLDALEEKLEWHNAFALIRGFIERAEGNTTEALTQFIAGSMSIDPLSKDYEESKEIYAQEVGKTLEKKADK